VRITLESFRATALEAWPLIQAHAAEVGLDRMERPWQPDWEAFYRLEEAGAMWWLTVRTEDAELIGYGMWYLTPSVLHRDLTVAICEAFYLNPHHRNGYLVLRLMRYGEDEARRRGALRCTTDLWNPPGRTGELLEVGGYTARKTILWKVLEADHVRHHRPRRRRRGAGPEPGAKEGGSVHQ
jgi:Acetyltransferase (GNAT) family